MSANQGWLPQLGVVSVAAPCSEPWEQMSGDAQVRHCGACKLNVYNLSELNADEARLLLNRTEGRMCVRFFVRPDGRLLTRDCPKGLVARLRRRVAAVAASVLALAVGLFELWGKPELPSLQLDARPLIARPFEGPRAELAGPVVAPDWADKRRAGLSLERSTQVQGRWHSMMGVIRIIPFK